MIVDLKGLGYEAFGWSKLLPGQKPKVGTPWNFAIEGSATVVGPQGLVTGQIANIEHVSAATFENPALGRNVYAVSPAGWPQMFWDQFNGGVLTVLYTIVQGKVFFGVTTAERFLHITNGKPDILVEFPGRFVGIGNKPDEAILEQLKGIDGLANCRLTYPIEMDGQTIPGTMANRAFDMIVDDGQSNKVAALFVPPSAIDVETMTMAVHYNPVMPPSDDKSREAEVKRKDIKFLKSVTTATFTPWAEVYVLGVDGIAKSVAATVHGSIELGLVPTK